MPQTGRVRPPRPLPALLSGLVLLVLGCSSPQQAATPEPTAAPPSSGSTGPAAVLRWSACESGFECASLPVPLGGDAGEIDLAVTRRRATGPGDRVGSLFVNPGGPGSSAVDFLQSAYGGLPEVLRQRFDLVAFDPRGVGRSRAVSCASTAELDRLFALDPSPDDAAELEALEQGIADLAAGCRRRSGELLAHVSTQEAAEDLDRLRAAVGDEQLTYLGYSYGTAIGAAYLDAHPTRVRAMVLDAALDPALTWDALLEGQSRGFDQALGAMLADCERSRCPFRAAVSGDLGAAYDALAARIDARPLPAGGSRTLGPGELSLGVGAGLYDREYGWPAVQQALADAQAGRGAALLALSDGYLERTEQGYAPVLESNTAVNCLDRPWPRDTAAYTALAERVRPQSPRFGPAIALSGLTCATWPFPPAGSPHEVRAPGSVPVVVIGTTRDPATPYAWSVALARQLEAGVLLTHEGDGHTVYRAGAPACLLGPVNDYLVAGTAPAPATC